MRIERPRAIVWLASLYSLAGLAFLILACLRVRGGADGDSTLAGFPPWALFGAAALDVALGAGILLRITGTLAALRGLHTAFAVGAAIAFVVASSRPDAHSTLAELVVGLGKVLVHACMAAFWWRSRTAASWFARRPREKAARS